MRSTFVHRKHWIILKWITLSGNFPCNILSIRKTGWGRNPHSAGRDFPGLNFQALQTALLPLCPAVLLVTRSPHRSWPRPGFPVGSPHWILPHFPTLVAPAVVFTACGLYLLAFYIHFATCQELWLKVQQRKHFKLLTNMRFDLLFAGSSYPCSVSANPRDTNTGFISFWNIRDDKTSLWPNQFRD